VRKSIPTKTNNQAVVQASILLSGQTLTETTPPERGCVDAHPDQDIVGFMTRDFAGFEAKGVVTITVQRSGPCTDSCEVKLQAREADGESNFKAQAKKEFEELPDITLKFGPGDRQQTFDVNLFQTNCGWQPTRYFHVEMVSCTPEESTVMGGPSLAHRKKQGPTARVLILQNGFFPSDEALADRAQPIRLVRHYIRERRKNRGMTHRSMTLWCSPLSKWC